MNNKKVLLMNDFASYGKVALSAMIPVLSHMKYEVFSLPTALVSNTLDYGKFDIVETTDYMKNTIEIWNQLQFSFDAISTGFILSHEQMKLILDFCHNAKTKGIPVFTDPIMGDDGKLYNGINESTVDLMRELISVADYIVPNYTEATYLAKVPYSKNGCTEQELYTIAGHLHALGAGTVLITSAPLLENNTVTHCVAGYDNKRDSHFIIPYKEIPVRYPGTGDIFSAVFMGHILDGDDAYTATKSAMNTIYEMLKLNIDNQDKYKGIPIELYLEAIQ